jgi:mannose-6-phosphate isomerase-like protein (cupin superfamily)
MIDKQLVMRLSDVEEFSPKGCEEIFSSRMLIDANSVGSKQLVVNEFTLNAGQNSYPGVHPPPYDEVYYVIKGKGWLILKDEQTIKYEVEPGIIAFIPAGTEHCLENPFPEDLVLLTFMPRQPEPGVNLLYDERKATWGTTFRMKNCQSGVITEMPGQTEE